MTEHPHKNSHGRARTRTHAKTHQEHMANKEMNGETCKYTREHKYIYTREHKYIHALTLLAQGVRDQNICT